MANDILKRLLGNSDSGSMLADKLGLPSLSELISTPVPKQPVMPRLDLTDPASAENIAKMSEYNNSKADSENFSRNFINSIIAGNQKPEVPLMLDQSLLPQLPQNNPIVESQKVEPTPASSNSSSSSMTKTSISGNVAPQKGQELPPAKDSSLEDLDYKKAQELAKRNREAANYNNLFADLSNAIIGQSGVYNPNNKISAIAKQAEMAEAPVKDIEAERAAYLKFLQNKEEREKNDPNSAVSVSMKKALQEMGVNIPSNASYATMEKLAPQLMKNKEFQLKLQEMALKREELAQNKAATNMDKMGKELYTARERIVNNSSYRGGVEALTNAQKVKNQVELARNGNGQAIAAVGAAIARVAGEKGVLSSEDVKRYVTNPTLRGQLDSSYNRLLKGKMNEADSKNILRLLEVAENVEKDRLGSFIKGQAKAYSKARNLDYNQVMDVFDPEGLTTSKSPAASQSINPEIKQYADQYFNGNIDAATKYLKDKGHLND